MSFYAAANNMKKIYDLYREATVKYRQGYFYNARICFIVIIQKLKVLKPGIVFHREVENELRSHTVTKTIRNSIETSQTNSLHPYQLLASSFQNPIDSDDHGVSNLDFVHLQSSIISPQNGFFDGILPLSHDTVESIESFISAVIYNLAVVSHAIGLSRSEDCQSVLFGKTMHLYTQAQLLVNTWYARTGQDVDVGIFTLIEAAITNNMAQIYRDYFLNTEKFDEMTQNLKRIVHFWSEVCIPYDMMPENYYDFFASNVRLSRRICHRTAPAA
jgi:hypothetical protein